MNVLGLDPGTLRSGFCLLDCLSGEVLSKGVLSFPELRKYIKKNRKQIHLVSIELPIIYTRMQPGTNVTLGIMLREVGRLEEVGSALKIPVVLISRADVLKVITGKRPSKGNKISKAQSQEALRALMGLPEVIRPQHTSDAACIAYAAYRLSTGATTQDEVDAA
jgi:Holliday junction resolvasome RuvABC endonuclease subunit